MLPLVNWSPKARRRWSGALCLLAAILMLIAGETWLDERLAGMWFISYWLVCFAFTILAICVAMLDARALRREIRQEQKDLFKSTFSGIEQHKHPDRQDNSA
ncbi:MAG TPA: hypothetical protein VKA67_11175 [Verrucomicrobiae bacterium]|nr:hypothetical protein [Verrucomicrobiae bacterium]